MLEVVWLGHPAQHQFSGHAREAAERQTLPTHQSPQGRSHLPETCGREHRPAPPQGRGRDPEGQPLRYFLQDLLWHGVPTGLEGAALAPAAPLLPPFLDLASHRAAPHTFVLTPCCPAGIFSFLLHVFTEAPAGSAVPCEGIVPQRFQNNLEPFGTSWNHSEPAGSGQKLLESPRTHQTCSQHLTTDTSTDTQ